MKLAFILITLVQSLPDHVDQLELNFNRYLDYQYQNQDSALVFLDRAIDEAQKSKLRKRQGELFREKGIFLKDNGQFQLSVDALTNAIQIFEEIKDEFLVAAAHNNLGVTYWRSGDNENALIHYFKSRELNIKLNNKPGLVRNHIALGNYFAREHEYRKAIENYLEAEKYAGHEDKSMLALILKNTGNIYNDEAFDGFNSQKAINYYQKSISVYAELGDTINIAGLHVNLGLIYENIKDFTSAERQYLRAIDMQNRLGLKTDVVNSYLNLGNVFQKKNDIAKAKESYLIGFKIAKSIQNTLTCRNLARNLSLCFETENNYPEAYRYFLKYDSMDQIIYTQQKTSVVKELETKYDTEKKQAEITLRTQQRDSIMTTFIVLLVMTIIIVLIYSQRQKMVVQLRERDRELMNKKVDELLREQEIKSLRSYLNGQDEERKRIAEDLHDRLGSTLSATKLYFNSITGSNPDKSNSFDKANELLDTAVEEVRDISHNLISGAISKFGLTTALTELKETISNTNQIKMEVFINGLDIRLNGKTELHLYRIIQELVSNILKHAKASEITIQLNKFLNELTLTVEDNGVGFNEASDTHKNGLGLKNIESRVQSLDGLLRIDTGKGNGTTVLITLPIVS